MGTNWPIANLVRETGSEHLEFQVPLKVSRSGSWDYQKYWPESRVRKELETAWLRGWAIGSSIFEIDAAHYAADYAKHIVEGPTRPRKPGDEKFEMDRLEVMIFHLDRTLHELRALLRHRKHEPLSTPSKDENSSQEG